MKMGEETDIVEPMPSEDVVAAENVTANEPSKSKRNIIRKRKRAFYRTLQKLMEFYLGDVNLNKDRFMSQQIQGQPFVYVDLSLFLTFNKVKALTKNVEDLSRALRRSEILQLSEDKTQVCRKTPIKKKENEDECTIYVEHLGPQMDHNFLMELFCPYGRIDYISIPRYATSGKFKGFAFIEFRHPKSAKIVLEAFNAKGCCLSPYMAPEELMSIKNFDVNKENEEENKGELDVKIDNTYINNNPESPDNYLGKTHDDESKEATNRGIQEKHFKKDRKKRKFNEQSDNLKRDSSIEFDQVECPKRRKKDKDCGSVPDKKISNKKSKKRNKSISHDKSLSDNASTVCKQESEIIVPKQENETIFPEQENEIIVPKQENEMIVSKQENEIIVPKQENETIDPKQESQILNPDEKSKRKKKKKKQVEEEMKTLSHKESHETLKKKKSNNVKGTSADDTKEENGANHETAEDKRKRIRKKIKNKRPSAFSYGLKVLPKKEWKQLRNKYLNMQRDMMRTLKYHLSNSQKSVTSQKSKEMVTKLQDSCKSGTVLKVILEEPVTNVLAAKGDMRIHPDIRYIDVTMDSPVVYLRTSTPEVANTLLSAQHWPNMQLVQGDEESEYWNKIKMDREEYCNKKKPNKKGRTKLLKRVEQLNGNDINDFE